MAGKFEFNYKYSTICSHRSTISDFHDKLDGVKVGSHPLISDLLSGVFNMNPPSPRYNFIWDVQQVLDYIRINLGEKVNK